MTTATLKLFDCEGFRDRSDTSELPEPPAKALAWKWNDPIDDGRWITNRDELIRLQRDRAPLSYTALGRLKMEGIDFTIYSSIEQALQDAETAYRITNETESSYLPAPWTVEEVVSAYVGSYDFGMDEDGKIIPGPRRGYLQTYEVGGELINSRGFTFWPDGVCRIQQ
jgi:hypothetical protein